MGSFAGEESHNGLGVSISSVSALSRMLVCRGVAPGDLRAVRGIAAASVMGRDGTVPRCHVEAHSARLEQGQGRGREEEAGPSSCLELLLNPGHQTSARGLYS